MELYVEYDMSDMSYSKWGNLKIFYGSCQWLSLIYLVIRVSLKRMRKYT